MALYKKSLNFSLVNSKTFNIGELVNYMQVDSQKLRDLPYFIGGVIFLPLQLGIAIFIMYEVIGISFIAGVGVMLITFVFNLIISKYFTVFQKKLLLAKDERMKLANEIISSIKMIKVNAWESFFLGKISVVREKELSWLKKSLTISVLLIFSLYLTPQLILGATFTMYTLMDNPMTAENVFTLVSTFVVVQQAIRWLPMAIAFMIQSYVSIKRIQGFLLAEEIDTQFINSLLNQQNHEKAIVMKNGWFFWDQETKKNEEEKKGKKKINEKNPKNNKESRIHNETDIRNFSIDIKDVGDIEKLKNNEFNYSYLSKDSVLHSKYMLKNINLEINKGSLTAIIGE